MTKPLLDISAKLDPATGALFKDLVPFGKLATKERKIVWPSRAQMDVTGYEEVFEASAVVRVSSSPELDIRAATPAGLSILKLLAWADSPQERGKDASDLLYLSSNYLDLGNWERLEKEDGDLTAEAGFTVTAAGPRLLGRDVAEIASAQTLRALEGVLQSQLRIDSSLVTSMGRVDQLVEGAVVLEMLESFLRGVKERA